MELPWKPFIVALIATPILDFIWLGQIMAKYYRRELGDLARIENGKVALQLGPAVLVYVFIATGIVAFVLPRAGGAQSSLYSCFLWGALFGLLAYGIYDMTNLSFMVRWPVAMSVVDIAWGAMVCGLASVLARLTL